ncbi:MAG: hypothetical protein KKA99_03530 [Gammaproteobacteria bacterium]|nr:hypothetical protein [Gammaproteobacteria bacterium]MBU1628946.1 hypothetical protein [Gammaproteobacteria bacterium]MBU1926395.1 hypothetical protein [Gammaproteobacteria bacterium]MBU2545936.1 hypothetical protein [Gammaproteobacteria bacterium]
MAEERKDIVVDPKKVKVLRLDIQQLLNEIRSEEPQNAAKFYQLISEFSSAAADPEKLYAMRSSNPFCRFQDDVLFEHYRSPWMEKLKRLFDLSAQVRAFSESYPPHIELQKLLARLDKSTAKHYLDLFDAIRAWSINPSEGALQNDVKKLLIEPKQRVEKLVEKFSRDVEEYEFTLKFNALFDAYEEFKTLSLTDVVWGVDGRNTVETEKALKALKESKQSIDSISSSEAASQCEQDFDKLIQSISVEVLKHARLIVALDALPLPLQTSYQAMGEESQVVKRAKQHLRDVGADEKEILSYLTNAYNARIDRQKFSQTFREVLKLTHRAKEEILRPGVIATRLEELEGAVDEMARLFVEGKLSLEKGKSANDLYDKVQRGMESLKKVSELALDLSDEEAVNDRFREVLNLSGTLSGAVNLYYMAFEKDQKCACLQSVMLPFSAVKTIEIACKTEGILINKLSEKISPIVQSSQRAGDVTRGNLSKIFNEIVEKARAEQKRGEQITQLYDLGTTIAETKKALLTKQESLPKLVSDEKSKELANQLVQRIGGEKGQKKPEILFTLVKRWFMPEREPSSSARMQSELGYGDEGNAKKLTVLDRVKKKVMGRLEQKEQQVPRSGEDYFVTQEGGTFDQIGFEKALMDPNQLQARDEKDVEKPVLHFRKTETYQTGSIYKVETPRHSRIDFYAKPKLYRTNDGSFENFKYLALIAQKTGYKTLGVERLPKEYQHAAVAAFQEVGLIVTGYVQTPAGETTVTPEPRSTLVL